MRKFLLAISFLLFTRLCFASPTVTIATPNSFSPNTTIYSSQVNSNFNEIQNKFNVHNHTDITQTGIITSGVWNGTLIGIAYGGTGLSSAGGVANRVMLTADGSTFSVGQVNLTTMVTGALPIANGGTGQTTQQTAIDALLPAQGSNSGKFLTTNGTTSSWGIPTTNIPQNIQVFTSTSTWTKPAGISTVYVKVWGGGGGGGTTAGGGGGGGGYSESLVTVTGDVTVTVGIGGTAGNPGVNGGNSSFAGSTTPTANGGVGGTSGAGGAGGAGGTATNGIININGGVGANGLDLAIDLGGAGGGSPMGGAGGGTSLGTNGTSPGGGGSGGANGANGLVIVYY